VAESQRQLAAAVGAKRSWYGVNGASGLLQAAMLGVCGAQGRVLMPRNQHRSLLHACVLGGLKPQLYAPDFDAATGLWQPLKPHQLEAFLRRAPPLDLLVLLSPTYQGLAADLRALVAVAHRFGVPVLVDESHGGHFGLDASLPGDGLAAGADLVVQSLHKSFAALGQTAVLHQQGELVASESLEQALLWLQTSSPSALLMLSAEQAVAHWLSPAGRQQLGRRLQQARSLAEQLRQQRLPLLPSADPLRLVLHTAPLGVSGASADDWLLQRGVAAECPELFSLTFCLGFAPSRGVAGPLVRAWRSLEQHFGAAEPLAPLPPLPLPDLAKLAISPGEAWRRPHEQVPLAAALGRIAARPLCPYPPGIPLLLPGERLDRERLEWLQAQQRLWQGQIADTLKVLV
jgi:lysine decarboxylase